MTTLTIEIPLDPDIAQLGRFLLTWHGLLTAAGVFAGLWLSLRIARSVGYDLETAQTIALVAIPAGIVGARLLYVWERWDSFSDDPARILQINEGGISIWGAILGGVGAAVVFAAWRGYPIRRGLDVGAFGLILGQAVGRIGDLIDGEHFARATGLPWGIVYTDPDSSGFERSLEVGPTHPAVAYELLGDLVILGVLFFVLYRLFWRRPGLTFFVYFVGYAALRFFLTFLRVDSSELLGLRIPLLIAPVVIVASIPACWHLVRQAPTGTRRDAAASPARGKAGPGRNAPRSGLAATRAALARDSSHYRG